MTGEVLGVADISVIAGMLVASAAIGLYFRFSGGQQKTTLEYLLGGKSMSVGPVAFSLMATCMSTIVLLGLPSETYLYGTQLTLVLAGYPIGVLIAAYGFLPVYFDMDVCSVYEYLEKRFGKTTRTVVSCLFIIRTVFYMAVVLFASSVAMNAVTQFSVWTVVIVLVAVATFYCYMGGLKAVLWTDVLQATLMYVPLVAVVVGGTSRIGFTQVFAKSKGAFTFLDVTPDLTVRYTFWNCALNGVYFGCELYGVNQLQIHRMMSIGNLKRAQKAALWGVFLIALFKVSCYSSGIVMYALSHDCDPTLDPQVHLQSMDQILPYTVLRMFGDIPGLPGLCLSGVLSASLGTISSTLNSLCSVVLEDFIKTYCVCKTLTDAWTSAIAKMLAILFGGVCLLLVILVSNFRGILEAATVLNGLLGAPILGVFLIGLLSTTANEAGALFGLVAGIVLPSWVAFESYHLKLPIETLPRSVDDCSVSRELGEYSNGTIFAAMNDTQAIIDDSRDVFPLYKISYMWLSIFGLLVSIVCGLVVSLLARFWSQSLTVDKKYLSPFVRRFHHNKTEIKKPSVYTVSYKDSS